MRSGFFWRFFRAIRPERNTVSPYFISFICPKCDALYCGKCAEALSLLDNACWVCNEPIETSKPVNRIEGSTQITENEIKSESDIMDESTIPEVAVKKRVFLSYSTLDSEYFKIPTIVERLKNYPKIERVSFWEADSGENVVEFMEKTLGKSNDVLIFDELEEGELKEIMRKTSLSLFIPLKTKEHRVGFLLLGEKSSGDIYFEHDLRTFEILAPEFAVALQNSQSYSEVQEFSRTLEIRVEKRTQELQEAQKRELTLKDEFVFIASHDLKTPVTAIDGFLNLIKQSKKKNFHKIQDKRRSL